MSILVPEEAEPSTPASGKAEIYVTVGSPGQLTVKHEDGSTVDLEAGAGGGETNTASNIGTDGVGVYDSKSVADLQFRNIAATEAEHLLIALDAGDNDIDLSILGSPTVKVIALKGSAGTITAGQVVYVSGWNVGGAVIEVELADSDNASAMPAIGIAQDSITSAASGAVIVQGPATANTAGKSVNDGVYVDTTAGAWTVTRPTGVTTAVQNIGKVVQVGASGTIFVAGALRSNDVPNLEDAKFWVGNGSNVATAVAMSSDATMSNTGAVTVADGADATAIHNNVASEISGITVKGSPVGGDFLLIEDSEAANVKKHVLISSMPAGSETNALVADGISGIADDQLPVGTGAGTAAYQTLPNGAVSYATVGGTFSQAASTDLSDTANIVLDNQGNTFSTGAQDFSSATSLTVPVAAGAAPTVSGQIAYDSTSNQLEYGDSTVNRVVANLDETQTLAGKTLTTPTIASFTNAAHDHADAAGGGQITLTTGVTGVLPEANGGTGTATWTAGDVVYSDATDSLAGLAKGTAFQHLRMNAGATAPEWTVDTKSKSILVKTPADGERHALWMNEAAITVLGVSFASLAGTSVLFNLEYAATIASGTVIHTDTCASSTPEWDVSPSGTAAVPTDQIVMAEITTVTGAVTDLLVTVHYRENV